MIGQLRNVVLDAPDIAALSAFYQGLAGWTQVDADHEWITLTTPDGWRIGLQDAPDHQPPRWPDPAHPQQAHLDLRVPDLDAAGARAEELGARRLGGGETWHTFADPAGHPFDLCLNADDPPMTIFAITVDCADAKQLSDFYGPLLGMSSLYDGPEGSLIGDGSKQVMFQQVETYTPPRWRDPANPQQIHLDVLVTDIDEAERQTLALGASRLDGEGENWHVFADPAGHPFCLVWTVG